MRAGCDYSGGAVVWKLSLQSRVHFSGILVPAQSALEIFCLQRQLGGALAQ